jgi:hypothetical protein
MMASFEWCPNLASRVKTAGLFRVKLGHYRRLLSEDFSRSNTVIFRPHRGHHASDPVGTATPASLVARLAPYASRGSPEPLNTPPPTPLTSRA